MDNGQNLADYYWFLKTQIYYRQSFHRIGPRSRILRPLRIDRPWNIEIGENVIINSYSWLFTNDQNGYHRNVKLIISDDCKIGHMNHIAAINKVYIGKRVLTADKVYISDHIHGFENPRVAIMDQPIISKGRVAIGEGTWIGENASILCAKIGKNCVVGAGAVVLKDVPDFCVVAGVPAKIIKKYDMSAHKWVSF